LVRQYLKQSENVIKRDLKAESTIRIRKYPEAIIWSALK
jgi:hypothetical protein